MYSVFFSKTIPRGTFPGIPKKDTVLGGVDVIYESPAKLVDEQDIIVAKMNYRLGPFGNWYMPVRIDGQPKSSFSIQDQRAGLKWIKNHIGKFNGDADDITLGAASAGGLAAMIHMTHPESHDYFHNALIIGAPQIKFWNTSEAAYAYGAISVFSQCTTEENMTSDLLDGSLLGCLKTIPLGTFQHICSKAGDIFKGIALNANHVSQLEQLFAINIDGEIVRADPRDEFKTKSNNVKSDMGFYLHELGRNEGTSLTENLFSNEQFKETLFGDNYLLIFQEFNSHVRVPKVAHEGLMKTMYGAAGNEVMTHLLHEHALGCPANPGDAMGLFTECKHKTSDWITSWLWHCNTRNFLSPVIGDEQFTNLYAIDFAAAYPGPNHGKPGVLKPDTGGVNDCYEAGGQKSCHIVGQAYLFGEAENQRVSQTDEEIAFGESYRSLYASLIKNGVQDEFATWTESNGQFNLVDIGETIITTMPYAMTCNIFDNLNIYGMI